jgi:hypothetical protein
MKRSSTTEVTAYVAVSAEQGEHALIGAVLHSPSRRANKPDCWETQDS